MIDAERDTAARPSASTRTAVAANEAGRRRALVALDILGTAAEPEYDAMVAAAAQVCDVPLALIGFFDAARVWLKAQTGLAGVTELPRDGAFDFNAMRAGDIVEIPDAGYDPGGVREPLVAGQPDLRFYAGAPLLAGDGSCVGILCVLDRRPRRLDDRQREALRGLAHAVSRLLEARAARVRAEARTASPDATDRLRELYELTPAMLQTIAPDGQLLAISDSWLAKLGYSRAAVVGRNYLDFVTPDCREHTRRTLLAALLTTGRFDTLCCRMVRQNGEIVDAQLSAVVEYDADGRPARIHAAIEDVTERLQAERALSEERGRLAAIIEAIGVGTWEWNVRTNAVVFNERWAELIGYTLEDLAPLSGQTWLNLVHPEDARRVNELLDEHFAGERAFYECEKRMRHRDGHWVWVLDRGAVITWTADGKPLWMFGTHEDITPRKRQAQALEAANERVTIATDSGRIGIWDWDVRTGRVLFDAWTRRLYGLDEGDEPIEGVVWRSCIHPGDLTALETVIADAIAGTAPMDLTFRVVWPDESVHHLRSSGRITLDDTGRAERIVGATWDITDLRSLADDLAEQHELLRVTLQSIGDAVITTDAQQNVIWLNPIAERMTGWPVADAQGQALSCVLRIEFEDTVHATLVSRDGERCAIEESTAPIRNARGEMLGLVLLFRDVSEQRRLSGEMSYRASHDALTGLINRSEFEIRLQRLLKRTQDDGSSHALLYIDLDQFKVVNDTCGHLVGDELLRQVAKLLAQAMRGRDTYARIGGDEFAVILDHCALDSAQRVAQQVCDRFDQFRFVHDGRQFRIGASVGLVPVDDRWPTTAALLAAADASCYSAKTAGRNRVHTWLDTDFAKRARRSELQWIARIERALTDERFTLFAQRIEAVAGSPGRISAEVLVRMIDTDGCLVLPGAFFPAAERFHLASRVDRWVLAECIAWMRALPALHDVESLSLNLSRQSIGDHAFHRWAGEVLAHAGAAIASRLRFEFSEIAAVANISDAAALSERLRGTGARVGIDDFGAGAASFGYLKTTAPNFLKIDRAFVGGLADDPLNEVAVRSFVDLAGVMGLTTIAKGVDRPALLERLGTLGVDAAQGFVIHRPTPIHELFQFPVALAE